ncbi:apolipoprotein C-IV [Clupea harengus]|uniref:Apolipoprotein C-IV n=1 Tax=Clupea harengus TaxID=7950 RepID=A0A8M1KM87_CLUHA|nr:apolipoprotein C-IV [Clupea harengus]
MSKNLAVLAIIFILQGYIQGSTPPPESESPGVIQRSRDLYWSTVERVQSVGEMVKGLAEMYYEDHVKGRVDPYLTWPSFNYTSAWNRVKARVPWSSGD